MLALFTSPAHAAPFDPTQGCAAGTEINTGLGCIPVKPGTFTPSLLTLVTGLAGGIALAVMLSATIQIMTGGGNPEAVKKGKELFGGAVMGLIFIIFSAVLMRIVAGGIIQLPGF